MKDELDGKIMSKFAALEPGHCKRGTNSKCVIKQEITFGDYKII